MHRSTVIFNSIQVSHILPEIRGTFHIASGWEMYWLKRQRSAGLSKIVHRTAMPRLLTYLVRPPLPCLLAAIIACMAVFYAPLTPAWSEQSQSGDNYSSQKNAYDLCTKAAGMMSAGDYAGARDALTQAVSFDPTQYSANAHTNLAECYRHLHDYHHALAEASQSLKIQPSYNSALFTMGMIYRDMNDLDKATEYLKRYAQTADPNTARNVQSQLKETRVWRNLKLASEYLNSRQEEKAVSLLEKAAKDDPSSLSGQVHAQLAYALRKTGAPERAVAEAKKALALDPDNKNAMYCLATACGDVGQFDEAIRWINKYVSAETDPVQRAEAQGYVTIFELDKQKRDNPATTEADYLDQRTDQLRWPKDRLPLKVCIGSGSGVTGYRKDFDTFITSALDNWCQGSKNKLEYKLVSNPSDADIVVRWTADSVKASDVPAGMRAAGVTDFDSDAQGNIKTADIAIRTVDAFNTSRALQDGECASVCIHEVGHALGLPHSTAIKDIMAYRSSAAQSGSLTARDKATISRLYGDYPALAFVPQSIPTATLKFLPPPAFMPPKPEDTSKLLPPMFLPPPIEREKKLTPPLFTPPPLRPGTANSAASKAPAVPSFLPPPVPREKRDEKPAAPFFTPPPK